MVSNNFHVTLCHLWDLENLSNQIYFFLLFVFAFNRHASATVGFEHQATHVCEAKNLHSS